MNTLRIMLGAVALLRTACAAVPGEAKVSIIRNQSSELARGKRFAWAPVAARGFGIADPKFANEITAERLKTATETTLIQKGYRQVGDPFEADLLVSFTVMMMPQGNGRSSLTGDGFDPVQDTSGILVLDLVERETRRLVWRATSEKTVTPNDVSQESLSRLLGKMTKALPQ